MSIISITIIIIMNMTLQAASTLAWIAQGHYNGLQVE